MPGLKVATIVDSILAAFENAADVFKRTRNEKDSKKGRKKLISAEEIHLAQSLSSGSLLIRSQYDRNVAVHGHHFTVGDFQTQTKLARILFDLNNGLVAVISSLLDRKSKNTVLAPHSLSNLTTKATADTLATFEALDGQLSMRAINGRTPAGNLKKRRPRKERATGEDAKPKIPDAASSSDTNPLLVRGGWIRTKSGNSVIISAENARRRATYKAAKKRVRPTKIISHSRREIRNSNPAVTIVPLHQAPPDREGWHYSLLKTQKIEDCTHKRNADLPTIDERPPSLYLVPAEVLYQQPTDAGHLPPRPPKIPLHSRPNAVSRLRPVSGMTFATESTKMGEIPENRIPDLPLSEEELRHRPLPYLIPPRLEPPRPKPRRGFWRFRLKK